MNTIKRYVSFLEIMSIAAMISLPLLTVLKWTQKITYDWFTQPAKTTFFSFSHLSQIPVLHKIVGFCIDSVGTLIILAGIYYFITILRLFKRQEFFTTKILKNFNKLSLIALCWALYSPLKLSLLSVIMTLHNKPGSRTLTIAFGTNDFINIVVFCFLIVLTAILQKAHTLQIEQDHTI